MPVTTNSGENGPVRDSAAGGINLQIERRRSASLLHRRAHQAGQSLAGLAHRRTDAMGLGGRARRNPPSGVTGAGLPKAGQPSQRVKAVRAENRLLITSIVFGINALAVSPRTMTLLYSLSTQHSCKQDPCFCRAMRKCNR